MWWNLVFENFTPCSISARLDTLIQKFYKDKVHATKGVKQDSFIQKIVIETSFSRGIEILKTTRSLFSLLNMEVSEMPSHGKFFFNFKGKI